MGVGGKIARPVKVVPAHEGSEIVHKLVDAHGEPLCEGVPLARGALDALAAAINGEAEGSPAKPAAVDS